tara:strand:+ start:416 stop:658 length:243 start_codon:yes stop_codon:yes gene_type:complete
MFEEYSIWTIVIIIGVSAYLWNERGQVTRELTQIDQISSYEVKYVKLLKLLIQLTSAVFVCTTFIFAILAIGLFNAGFFK